MKNTFRYPLFIIGSILAYLPICGEGGCHIADPSAPVVFNANPGDVFVTVSDTIQLGATLFLEYITASASVPQCGYEMKGLGFDIDSSVIPMRTGTTSNGNAEWSISKEFSGLKNGVYYTIRGYVLIDGKKSFSDPVHDHSHFTATNQPTEWVRLADLPSDNAIISGSCIVGGGSCFGFGDIYHATTNSWYTPSYKFLNPDPGNSQFPVVSGPIFMMGGSLYRYSQSRSYYRSLGGGTYSQVYFDVLESIDTSTHQFLQYPNDSTGSRTSMIVFSLGGAIYAGGGCSDPGVLNYSRVISYYTDFWKFDPAIKRWLRMKDVPMNVHQVSFSASAAGKGYAAIITTDSLESNEFWEYDPLTDQWKKKNAPAISLWGSWNPCSDGQHINAISSGLVDDVTHQYLPNTFGLWEYSPASDSWRELDNTIMPDGMLGTDGASLYLLGASRNINGAHRFWKYAL